MYYFNREEQWQKDLIKQIAEEEGLDIRVVRTMVYYPILFLKRRMQDSENELPVRIRNLGVFTLKPNRSKKQM